MQDLFLNGGFSCSSNVTLYNHSNSQNHSLSSVSSTTQSSVRMTGRNLKETYRLLSTVTRPHSFVEGLLELESNSLF